MIRPDSTTDDATPNPNAVAAQNLVRLAVLTGDDPGAARSTACSTAILPLAGGNLFGHVALLNALDLRLRAAEIVVTGSGPRAEALVAAALALPFLDRIVLRTPNAEALSASHPARDKVAASTDGAAFICAGERCSLPVTESDQLGEAVARMRL